MLSVALSWLLCCGGLLQSQSGMAKAGLQRWTGRVAWLLFLHSKGGAGIGGLHTEPTDDAMLGARWDPLLLTELPSLNDGRDRSDHRSPSSSEIRSNSLAST